MKPRTKRVIGGALAALVAAGLVLALFGLEPELWSSRRVYICSRCRALKHSKIRFGLTSQWVEDTDYSNWYQQEHPKHKHRWFFCHGGYRSLGGSRAVLCSAPGVTKVVDSLQRHFVETANQYELEQYYRLIESARDEDHKKAERMVYEAFRDRPTRSAREKGEALKKIQQESKQPTTATTKPGEGQ